MNLHLTATAAPYFKRSDHYGLSFPAEEGTALVRQGAFPCFPAVVYVAVLLFRDITSFFRHCCKSRNLHRMMAALLQEPNFVSDGGTIPR